MEENVFVVTCPEMGWDCVVGGFQGVTKEQIQEKFPSGEYVISEITIERNLDDWD